MPGLVSASADTEHFTHLWSGRMDEYPFENGQNNGQGDEQGPESTSGMGVGYWKDGERQIFVMRWVGTRDNLPDEMQGDSYGAVVFAEGHPPPPWFKKSVPHVLVSGSSIGDVVDIGLTVELPEGTNGAWIKGDDDDDDDDGGDDADDDDENWSGDI